MEKITSKKREVHQEGRQGAPKAHKNQADLCLNYSKVAAGTVKETVSKLLCFFVSK